MLADVLIWIEVEPVPDGKFWSAYCRQLGSSGCGKTKEEAATSLEHAVSMYCRALDDRGLLHERLEKLGIAFMPMPARVDPATGRKLIPMVVMTSGN